MPNYIQNKLVVNCKSAEELQSFLNTIEGEEDRVIDFNKITPMPIELIDTEESSTTYENLYYYLNDSNKLDEVEKIGKTHSLLRYYKPILFDKSEKDIKEKIKKGEQSYNNFIKYGFVSWYGWSLYHWGTKWNAKETYIIKNRTCATIGFVTAWSGVPLIIEKLAKIFPNVYFEYSYADEDRGCNVGFGTTENGEFLFTEIEDNSKEALDLYTELWGEWEDEWEEEEEN